MMGMANEDDKTPSLEALGEKLKKARARKNGGGNGRTEAAGTTGAALGLGFRIVTELVAAIAVGAIIGYGLDSWLGSAPWFMVVFLFLGGASGVMNAHRAAKSYAARAENGPDR